MSPLAKRRRRVHKTAVHTVKAVPKKTVPKKCLRAKSCSKSACAQKAVPRDLPFTWKGCSCSKNASRSHGKAASCSYTVRKTKQKEKIAEMFLLWKGKTSFLLQKKVSPSKEGKFPVTVRKSFLPLIRR